MGKWGQTAKNKDNNISKMSVTNYCRFSPNMACFCKLMAQNWHKILTSCVRVVIFLAVKTMIILIKYMYNQNNNLVILFLARMWSTLTPRFSLSTHYHPYFVILRERQSPEKVPNLTV